MIICLHLYTYLYTLMKATALILKDKTKIFLIMETIQQISTGINIINIFDFTCYSQAGVYVPTSIPICLSASLPTKAQYKFVSWFKIHIMQENFLHNLSRDIPEKHLRICKCVVHIDEDLKFKNSFIVIFNAGDLLWILKIFIFI